jgi:hypothetical protein
MCGIFFKNGTGGEFAVATIIRTGFVSDRLHHRACTGMLPDVKQSVFHFCRAARTLPGTGKIEPLRNSGFGLPEQTSGRTPDLAD